jgi:hypothetical protein
MFGCSLQKIKIIAIISDHEIIYNIHCSILLNAYYIDIDNIIDISYSEFLYILN